MRDSAGLMIHHQTTAQHFAFSPGKPTDHAGWWGRPPRATVPGQRGQTSLLQHAPAIKLVHRRRVRLAGQAAHEKAKRHIGPCRPGGLEIEDAARSISLL